MKVLITGGTGLLGKSLIDSKKKEVEIIATYFGNYTIDDNDQVKYAKIDVRDEGGCTNLFQNHRPDITIHTAGIGSPDFAETNKEIVWDININGTQNILNICKRFDSRFIYISSNGIYDGRNAPYAENDIAEPVNHYGLIKLKGEEITKKTHISHTIIRPILMYGWHHTFERANIVTQAISKLRNKDVIHAYDDVFTNPLLNSSCAKAIWTVIDKNIPGIFNIAGADRVSVYELLIKVAETFNLSKNLIIPVQQGYFNELAKRPKDTSFKTDKMEKVLGIKPLALYDGLAIMKETQT